MAQCPACLQIRHLPPALSFKELECAIGLLWRAALGSWTNHAIALRQISVTALFYLEDIRRIHPQRREESGGARQCAACSGEGGGEREREGTHEGGREREPFGPSFYMFFSSSSACPMQIGLRQERSST